MEPRKKKIALAADQNRMADLVDWAQFNRDLLAEYDVCTIDAAFNTLSKTLNKNIIRIQRKKRNNNGKFTADKTVGDFDFLVLFVEPSETPLDDPEIIALLNSATVRNIPIAGNRAAADLMFPYYLINSE